MRQINLLPKNLQKDRKNKTVAGMFIWSMLPLLIVLTAAHYLMLSRVARLKEIMSEPLNYEQSAKVKELYEKINRSKIEINKYLSDYGAAAGVLSESVFSSKVLASVAGIAAGKVWFENVAFGSPDSLSIAGKAFGSRSVSEFMLETQKLPYFDSIDLISMGKNGKAAAEEINFKITCVLK